MEYKSLKILIIATTKFDLNGTTNVIMNYYRYMNKEKLDIDFVVPNNISNSLRSEIEVNGGKIYKIPMRNSRPIKYMFNLTKVIKNNKYDIVHAHGNSSTLTAEMFSAWIGNVKTRIVHSHSTSCKYKTIDKILRPIFYKLYTHAIACSDDSGVWLFKEREYLVLNNGIDVERFAFNQKIREEYRKDLNIENSFVIGHIGYFNYPKNQEFLIDVFYHIYKKQKNAILILIGDGRDRKNIEKKIEKLKIEKHVVLLGERADISNLLQAIDVFVLPSFFEGFSIVTLEAQAASLKTYCSTNVPKEVKVSKLVEFLSLDDSAQKWAERIMDFEVGYKRKNMIENESFKNYDIVKIADKLRKYYIKADNRLEK